MTTRKPLLLVALAIALLAGLGTVGYQLASRPAFISYRVDLHHTALRLLGLTHFLSYILD